jgi:hypothetical protein
MFAVEHLNSSKAVQTVALGKFYRKLNQTRAFDADTPAGQAMRGFAAALALAGAAFSLKAAIDDPNGFSVAKAGVDAASAVQRMSDLLRSLGVENSVIRGAGGGWKLAWRTGAKIGAAEILTLASTMIEGAKTIRHLSKGEIADGAFSAGIALGGAISMLPVFIQAGSVAGPIGIAIMTAALIGQMVWQNAKHIHDGEGEVSKALVHLGYKPEYAAILCKRVDFPSHVAGTSQTLLLGEYAKHKNMTPEQLRDWINGLRPDEVGRLSEAVLFAMNEGLGHSGGRVNPMLDFAVIDSLLDRVAVPHPPVREIKYS